MAPIPQMQRLKRRDPTHAPRFTPQMDTYLDRSPLHLRYLRHLRIAKFPTLGEPLGIPPPPSLRMEQHQLPIAPSAAAEDTDEPLPRTAQSGVDADLEGPALGAEGVQRTGRRARNFRRVPIGLIVFGAIDAIGSRAALEHLLGDVFIAPEQDAEHRQRSRVHVDAVGRDCGEHIRKPRAGAIDSHQADRLATVARAGRRRRAGRFGPERELTLRLERRFMPPISVA